MSMLYSPSSREDFSFCPRAWYLRKNGLVTRTIEYPELCAIGGNAVGKAMEHWNKALMEGQEVSIHTLRAIGISEAIRSLQTQLDYGRNLGAGKVAEFDLETRVAEAISILWVQNPLKPYAILAAEEAFPHAGNSRLDVRVKQADGRQMVVDYKVKFGPTEERYYAKAMQEYKEGEQRLTYTHLTKTDMFGIIMVCLQPLKDKTRQPLKPYIRFETWPVREEEKQVWLRDALLMTPEMDHVLTIQSAGKVRGRTFPHANQFGDCKYSDACLRYQLDEEKMSLDYVWIKKEGQNG